MSWLPEEDQIIFDATLRGDGWGGMIDLTTYYGRTRQSTVARIRALQAANRLPLCWMMSHGQAQRYLITDAKRGGETALTPEEWEELAIWDYNDYTGINPSIFHKHCCTERLRKETRVLQDIDDRVIELAAATLIARRASRSG